MIVIRYSCNYSNTCQNNHTFRVDYENGSKTSLLHLLLYQYLISTVFYSNNGTSSHWKVYCNCFWLLYLESGNFLSTAYLPIFSTTWNLGSFLGLSIQSDSSSGAGLLIVTQSFHLLKKWYRPPIPLPQPQLVLQPHCSKILHQKQADYRFITQHPALRMWSKSLKNTYMKEFIFSFAGIF